MNFSSLLQASERKSHFDDLVGSGEGPQSLAVTALPQGTVRKHHKGYEEVIIPPTAAAQMKAGEKLVFYLSFSSILFYHDLILSNLLIDFSLFST